VWLIKLYVDAAAGGVAGVIQRRLQRQLTFVKIADTTALFLSFYTCLDAAAFNL
jgi:hypothetical protein